VRARGPLAAILGAGLVAAAGCAHNPPRVQGAPGTSPAPDVPWVAPARPVVPPASASPKPSVPRDLEARVSALTLLDIADLALRNSPATAEAWARARSAAAAYGSARSDYYPKVNGTAAVARGETSTADGGVRSFSRTYGPGADLSWLLFDFGGREAAVDEKRQALLAADFSHNAVIQAVILQVEQAYFQYVGARALLAAETATLAEATANLEAAEGRHREGVATIADVLQAKTARSQAQLVVNGLQGRILTTRGALATAMGLPANTPYDVAAPPADLPLEETGTAVEAFIALAQERRPDLAAARARAAQSEAHLKSVKAERYPAFTVTGSAGRTYYDASDLYGNSYSLGLGVRVPLFDGFQRRYDALQARADADASRAQVEGAEQAAVLQVWSSYYTLKTAEQQILTSGDLLQSAGESHKVALGRYRAGVGNILDLLAAQSSLETARALQVQARSEWYTALAELAYASGTLSLEDRSLQVAVPTESRKDAPHDDPTP